MSHISDQQIEQYRARSAGPEEILSIDDHLFTCGFCLQRLKSASGRLESGNVAIGLSPDDDDDPLYAQVESYVDDALPPSEREYFEKHMLECRTCREEVRDLLSFKAALHETVPGAAVTELDSVTVSGVAATASGAWNSRLFWFGAYAALLILAVTGVWLLNASQRKQMRALEAEVEALQQANKTLAQRTGQISQLNDRLNNIEESGSSLAASIELHDGERIINLRGGVLEGLDGVSARSQTAVKAALTEGKARVPSLKELESRVSVLMGGSDTAVSFSIKHPVGVVIEDTQPVFEWDPLDGAISYTVAIQSAKSKQVWTSPPITDTHWKPPSRLKRGEVYSWEVRASLNGGREMSTPGPTDPSARFKIVSEAGESEIERARRLEPPCHLLNAVLCARAGLVDCAKRELSVLERENPQSKVVRQLLESVEKEAPYRKK